jgi:uncharacterized membrane protein
MKGLISGFFLLLILAIAAMWILNVSNSSLKTDVESATDSTPLKILKPVGDFLSGFASKQFTLPAGVIAIIVLFAVFFLGGRKK